ncbi:tRNA (guanosine(37)-N1)-methyltransferase TrmD, partial [bacterium]|nr:tRNA (guanosine(37)-N1)-methyltransferase TrmD [bacterium]
GETSLASLSGRSGPSAGRLPRAHCFKNDKRQSPDEIGTDDKRQTKWATSDKRIILMSPQGKRFDQGMAKGLVTEKHLVFICGHYEGIDERVKRMVTDEISIGDYVLTGGELAALVVIDALVRLIPGVLGKEESIVYDSFYSGLLDYPHYTRPEEYRGLKVPKILLSGDHKRIAGWRRKEALRMTLRKRPDLLQGIKLSSEDKRLLREIKGE